MTTIDIVGLSVGAVLLVLCILDVVWRPIPGVRWMRLALAGVGLWLLGRFTGRAVGGTAARPSSDPVGGSETAPPPLTARPVHADQLEELEAEAEADETPEPDRSGSARDRWERL